MWDGDRVWRRADRKAGRQPRWTFGWRMTNRVQGGNDEGRRQGGNRRIQGGSAGGRSQGEDRRDSEQEEPGTTQAAAMMATHGVADGGRSQCGGRTDDSRGATDGGVAEGVESRGGRWLTTDQGRAGGTREPGGAGGLMGQGGEDGARSHGGAAGPKGRGGVRDSEAERWRWCNPGSLEIRDSTYISATP